jgi:glutamate racemase
MVEAGELDSPAVEIAVRTVVDKLPGIDALLLACTHYPALKPVIARVFPHVQILDPGAAMASSVHEQGSKAFEFFTTGRQGDSARAALLAFGVEIGVGGRALQYCLPPT